MEEFFMKRFRLKFKIFISMVLVLCIAVNIFPRYAQGSQNISLINQLLSEYTERHQLWGVEWIYTFHEDGTLSITPESREFVIALNNNGEVFIEAGSINLMNVSDEFFLLVENPDQSLQLGVSQITPDDKTHILTLREFNDSALEVEVFNGSARAVTSITGNGVTDYLDKQNSNHFADSYIEPFAAVIVVIPIAVILALLAISVIVIYFVVISGPSPIVGNNDVRRALENLGSAGIRLGRDLVNAVSAAFRNTINATINRNFHNHHIVARSDTRAQGARNVLNSVNPIIGINSATNMVMIRASLHSRLHTNAYYDAVNALLIPVNGNRISILARLSLIRTTLRAASEAIPF